LQNMVGSTLDYMRGLTEGGETVQLIDVTALISSLKKDAEEAGHTVTISGDARSPVMGRAQALKRCLQNLIDNALAYGRRADITLRDEGGALNIAISDDGPGIPEDDIERVFEPFYRIEASRNRNSGGSGLGLSIARNIAQSHGGSVRLRNLRVVTGSDAADSSRRFSAPVDPVRAAYCFYSDDVTIVTSSRLFDTTLQIPFNRSCSEALD